MATAPNPAPPPLVAICEAELASGPSGAVIRGAETDFATAVARRRAGKNIVVRGDDLDANRKAARDLESAVGPCKRAEPHRRYAGQLALPHYEPEPKVLPGHTFYETARRKARKP
jgi:hypothetical protein